MAKILKNGAMRLTADDLAAYDRLRKTTIDKVDDVRDLVPNLNRSVKNAQIKAFYELDEDERAELFGDRL